MMVSIFAYWPFVQLVETVYSDPLPILKLDFLLLLGCKSYLFKIQVPFQICDCKFFSHCVDCLFIFLMMSFDAHSLSFDDVRCTFFFCLLRVDIPVRAPFVEKTTLSIELPLLSPLKPVDLAREGSFLASQFYSTGLYSILMPVPHCLDYCRFIVSFGIKNVNLPILFFLTTVLANLGPLPFRVNFKVSLPKPTESVAGVGSVLSLQTARGLRAPRGRCCLALASRPALAAPWTVARQAPLPVGFSRPEHCSGLPFPSRPRD